MENLITGKQLLKRWERWKIERHDLMKMITCDNERGGYHFQDFCTELWPYSPAYLTPYRLDIHKFFQKVGKEWADHCFGFVSPPLPLSDNHNWECCHIVKFPADIWNTIEEVLFKITDIEAYEKAHFSISEPKVLVRRIVAYKIAETLKQQDKNMTIIEAVCEVNRFLTDYKLATYSPKQLKRIIKDLGFPPGISGPKTKK